MRAHLSKLLLLLQVGALIPSGAWLDSQPKSWNRPGIPLPRAPKVDQEHIPPVCKPLPHRTGTPEEHAVTDAGWFVFTSLRDSHGITVVGASSDFDGMCRPNQYQDFVFVGGKFAGTLSPILMGARSDG